MNDPGHQLGDNPAVLYVVYHKQFGLLRSSQLIPIQVGRALAGAPDLGIIGDDTGDNISSLNRTFCELTAHYWLWKNIGARSAIGLMHYRRLFDFSSPARSGTHPETYAFRFDKSEYVESVKQQLSESSNSQEVVVPRPMRLRQTLSHQYARCHDADDLAALRDVVQERQPAFSEALDNTLSSRLLLIGNMFIMPREVFDDYSSLLFDVLFELHNRIGQQLKSSDYQSRFIGFLAERVLTAYTLGGHMASRFPDVAITYREIMNIDDRGFLALSVPQRVKLLWNGQVRLRDASRIFYPDRFVA